MLQEMNEHSDVIPSVHAVLTLKIVQLLTNAVTDYYSLQIT